MIYYHAGQLPDFCEPDPEELGYRFALGAASRSSKESPPLVAIGMNPSHASKTESDQTVNRLIKAAADGGYSGWLMLNLYPERSPAPSALSKFDIARSDENCQVIERLLQFFGVTEVLAAWGDLPHPTLQRALIDVQKLLTQMRVREFTLDPLTARGNPRHLHPRGQPLPMLGPKKYLT